MLDTRPWGVRREEPRKEPRPESKPESRKGLSWQEQMLLKKAVNAVTWACTVVIAVTVGCAAVFVLAKAAPAERKAGSAAPVDGHWWSPQADLETYYGVPPAGFKPVQGQPGVQPVTPSPQYELLRKKCQEAEERLQQLEERLREDRDSGKMQSRLEFRGRRMISRW